MHNEGWVGFKPRWTYEINRDGDKTTINYYSATGTTYQFARAAQSLSGQVTPTQFNSKRGTVTEHHTRATMARLNQTRVRSRQRAFKANVSLNRQPSPLQHV
jgi:hypothetical protein